MVKKNTLNSKVLSIGSGKGGVGKTTTSVNLALYASRRGMRTLIVDADPLSDIATLLDLEEPEDAAAPETAEAKNIPLEKLAVPVFSCLDLLKPRGKKSPRASAALLDRLLDDAAGEFQDRYSLIILDLPAGILTEQGLDFLKKTEQVIVVTNDEPTSHVSAGAFIKAASEVSPTLGFRIWHNKYAGITREGFDPRDLPGNYNRNVPPEDHLDFSLLDMKDAAYIPEDPALDLLKSSPDLNLNIKRQMLERVEMIYRERISRILDISGISSRLATLLENYLFDLPTINREEDTLTRLGEELKELFQGNLFSAGNEKTRQMLKEKDLFTGEEKTELLKVLRLLKDDNLSASLRRFRIVLSDILEDEENSQRLFFQETSDAKLKSLDRELSIFLALLAEKHTRSGRTIQNLGGLLLYDFSLFKLFKSPTIRNLIIGFIPWRENPEGKKIRDKNSQIRWLTETDGDYRSRFLSLIKTLYPVLLTQIKGVAEALELKSLLFKKEGRLNGEVYLRLLTSFLHDVLNSGLGVIIGFKYRPASRAFQKGAARIIQSVEEGSDE